MKTIIRMRNRRTVWNTAQPFITSTNQSQSLNSKRKLCRNHQTIRTSREAIAALQLVPKSVCIVKRRILIITSLDTTNQPWPTKRCTKTKRRRRAVTFNLMTAVLVECTCASRVTRFRSWTCIKSWSNRDLNKVIRIITRRKSYQMRKLNKIRKLNRSSCTISNAYTKNWASIRQSHSKHWTKIRFKPRACKFKASLKNIVMIINRRRGRIALCRRTRVKICGICANFIKIVKTICSIGLYSKFSSSKTVKVDSRRYKKVRCVRSRIAVLLTIRTEN